MKKRILAIILCVCLLVPFVTAAGGQVLAEEEEAKKEFVIRELKGRVSAVLNLEQGGLLLTSPEFDFDPIDVSGAEGAYDFNSVAIQFDTYIQGTDSFVEFMTSGALSGQLEATSSGMCDEEELGAKPGNVLKFAAGEWRRVTVPLSSFSKSIGDFDRTNFNFIRIYLEGGGPAYAGATGTVKLVNWCIVDFSVPVEDRPTEAERPLGDGTFRAEAPTYKKMEIAEGYDNRVDVFAGFNMKEYLDAHPEIDVGQGDDKDYAPVINSLLESLGENGGGALFIPAGIYPCRSEINLPVGTTIVGEWANPDENPDIRGTILAVYCGANTTNGSPFISMDHHSKVNNIAFWYPEQTADAKIQYPPTIDMYQYTFVENVTFVNSFFAIQQQRGANCPNAWNIYGTPLNIGIDFDMVVDIARIQEIHFSADYWINSGLAGAPSTDAEIEALENQLYDYAIGITLRRIDWSYVTYSDIIGYNIGLLFDESIEGNLPNGQCVGLNFINCKYGHFSYGTAGSTESMLDITMKNCEYGVYITGEHDGALRYYNADIQATKYAVYQDSAYTKLTLMASTVRGGRVYTKNGNNTFINNKFQTAKPHIELDYGTIAGIVIGNTDGWGDAIVCSNPGGCTYSYVETPVKLEPYTEMTREEAYGKVPAPTSENYRIPTDIDTTGETDATVKIQQYLTELGNLGGGTLFLVPGRYRINGTLAVPTGVELRGAADFASIPKAVNTMFFVYTPVEAGKNEYTSTATVTLAENSGIRGIIFNYPEQHSTYRPTEKVLDPVATAENGVDTFVQYYEFDFIPYPYTIRGAGADVYVVNVSVRNGWNGIDFMTNRCDNHYVDYLSGHFFNRGLVVGNGSTGGYIRNFQFNYNSIQQALSEIWNGFGGEPSTRELVSAFHQPMQAQFQNNSIILQLGYVEDQLVYNCFNYSSMIGVHLIDEGGRAANARIFGHGVDYGNVSLQIEAAEDVEFTNMQLTAFNQCGDNGNTGRWAVDQAKKPIYDIWLKDTFEGEITITNFVEWAPTPTAGVRVDSGTLNMYNAQFSHTKSHLFELNGDGVLNIIGFCCDREDNPVLVDTNHKNLHITAGFYYSEPTLNGTLGTYEHLYQIAYRYSVPKNVIFTEDSEILFVESLDTYDLTEDPTFAVSDTRYGTMRRGAIRTRLLEKDYSQSIMLGYDKYAEETPFALESGKKNDLYRLEWRIVVDKMRDSEDSEICMYLTNAKVNMSILFTIKRDGSVYDQTNKKIGTIKLGEYYRFAIEVDARNANSKTATVYLLNDDSRVIGKGDTTALADIFQGENTVTGFQLSSIAFPYEGTSGTETDLSLDYFYVCRSEQSSIGRNIDPNSVMIGDVDNNGKVDSTDARLVLQYAVKKITSLAALDAADVNSDGKVDSTDARLILQYSVKKITSF